MHVQNVESRVIQVHAKLTAMWSILFEMRNWNLVHQVLFFYSYTPYLFQNAYFLWRMLNTGTHRKRISMVNRSSVPKPVIRMLCASLAYKKRVIRIHSNLFHTSSSVKRFKSLFFSIQFYVFPSTWQFYIIHHYWYLQSTATFVGWSDINGDKSVLRTKEFYSWGLNSEKMTWIVSMISFQSKGYSIYSRHITIVMCSLVSRKSWSCLLISGGFCL